MLLLANHISYYISYLGMNYNNVMGFLSFMVFIIQFMSGILLCCYFIDYYHICFDSVIYIMIDVNIGWFIRFLHVMGVSLFMLFIYMHWMSGIWMKFKLYLILNSNLNIMWMSGLLLFMLSSMEGFLGYMLILGQMSYWGITVMLNSMSMMPYFANLMMSLMWCSSQIMMYRVFVFHFYLGILMSILILMHILMMHSYINSNPFISSSSSMMMPFYPLMYKDLFLLFSMLFIGSFMFYLDPDMLGNSDNLMEANPLETPHI